MEPGLMTKVMTMITVLSGLALVGLVATELVGETSDATRATLGAVVTAGIGSLAGIMVRPPS